MRIEIQAILDAYVNEKTALSLGRNSLSWYVRIGSQDSRFLLRDER